MATHTVDANEFNPNKPWRATPSNQSSLPLPSDTLIARTAVTPKTRIVVVRTTTSTQDENGETVAPEEPPRSKSVELPPMFTNGRTSVYLIRRPIPPPETPKETLFYQSNDYEEKRRRKTTTTHAYDSRSSTPIEDIVDKQDPSHQNHSTSREPRNGNDRSNSPTDHPSNDNRSKSPNNNHRSSPTQSGNSQPNKNRSRTRGFVGINPRRRSRGTKRRISPEHQAPTSPPPPSPPITAPTSPKQEESTESAEPTPKRKLSASSQEKSIPIQDDSISTITRKPTERTSRAPAARRLRRRKSTIERVKSPKSHSLAGSDDQTTTTVIEDVSVKREQMKTSFKSHPNSVKRTRFSQEIESQSTEKLIQTSRWQKCFGCLLRHMCLIVIICLILILIGLAGVGVSAYFLAINSQDNLIPTVIGIAVGGALAIFALCFLCCILACIGSREGYFKYNGQNRHGSRRAFALISPTHHNAHRYITGDYTELSENKTTSASSIVNRQRTILHNGNLNTMNNKNVTIQMPERLLTGKKMSPTSHKRKLNKVVHHIGHVVIDTQKRYPGDAPMKVIVKMDGKVKGTA